MARPPVPPNFFEPKRKNRMWLVAGMSFVYASSFIPPPWSYLGEIASISALILLLIVVANYIYDGEVEDE